MQSNYICHHGIKGQRWGVRRFQDASGGLTAAGAQRYQSAMKRLGQSKYAKNQGYIGERKANLYVQKKDIKALKKQKNSGNISKQEYKDKKQAIKAKNSISRGKSLVEHNQSYGKIAVKGLAKQVGLHFGKNIAGNLMESLDSHRGYVITQGIGSAAQWHYAIDDVRKIADVHSYKTSKYK